MTDGESNRYSLNLISVILLQPQGHNPVGIRPQGKNKPEKVASNIKKNPQKTDQSLHFPNQMIMKFLRNAFIMEHSTGNRHSESAQKEQTRNITGFSRCACGITHDNKQQQDGKVKSDSTVLPFSLCETHDML